VIRKVKGFGPNLQRFLSLIANVRERAMSNWKIPGPFRELILAVPSVADSWLTKAAGLPQAMPGSICTRSLTCRIRTHARHQIRALVAAAAWPLRATSVPVVTV